METVSIICQVMEADHNSKALLSPLSPHLSPLLVDFMKATLAIFFHLPL